jgi:hypothetical protein
MGLLLIGLLIAAGWLVLCALVIAVCASAKEGDGAQDLTETPAERRLPVAAGSPSLARR